MLNPQEIYERWPQIKTAILQHWTKLNDEDVERGKDNFHSIGRIIQAKYGGGQNFEQELEQIFISSMEEKSDVKEISTPPAPDEFNPIDPSPKTDVPQMTRESRH